MSVAKPAYTTSLATLKGGTTLPKELMAQLCKEHPSAAGWAVREKNGIVIEKFSEVDSPEAFVQLMQEVNEGTKAFSRMFCFHAYPEEFDEDEVQPFVIIRDSKKNPVLVVGIEGDFPTYAGDKDGFSEPFCVVNDWLGPKLEQIYSTSGNSPQKLFDYCRSAQFQSDFGKELSHRGALHFLPSTGEAFVIEKNELGAATDWGFVSNACGWTPPKAEVVSEAPAAAEAPVKRRSKYASADPEPAKVEPKPVIVPPEVAPVPSKDPVERVATKWVESMETLSPAPNLHGKQLKKWYRDKTGELPTNWGDRPQITIKVKRAAEPSAVADTAIATVQKTIQPEVKGETMPIINGEQQKKAAEMIKKFLGDGSAVIDDPVQANKDESKLAKFHELMGLPRLLDINKFRTSFIFQFTKDNPEVGALAIIELRQEVNRLFQVIADGSKTMGELTNTDKPVEPVSPWPAPAVEPEPVVVPERRRSKYA